MHIKLLSNVHHDGTLLPAGLVCQDVPEEASLPLIASGAAVEIDEILVEPPAPLLPMEGENGAAPDPSTPVAPADQAPVVEPDTEVKAETGKKAAKAEGK